MRRVIYDKRGAPRLYLTGAGVVYNLRDEPLGFVNDERVADVRGAPVAWFDGSFLWDVEGKLLGFVKGAPPAPGFTLPTTQPLRVKPSPQRATLAPFLLRSPRPSFVWAWSEGDAEGLFEARVI